MRIVYEKHPVSNERKAELRKNGFKIVDIAYKPHNHTETIEKPKKIDKPKSEHDNSDKESI